MDTRKAFILYCIIECLISIFVGCVAVTRACLARETMSQSGETGALLFREINIQEGNAFWKISKTPYS